MGKLNNMQVAPLMYLTFLCVFGMASANCLKETSRVRTIVCRTAEEMEWCKCDGDPNIDLTSQYTQIGDSSLRYFVENGETTAIRCSNMRDVCLCGRGPGSCISCVEPELFCVTLGPFNNVITKNKITSNSCNVSELCSSNCTTHCRNRERTPTEPPLSEAETQPPPIRNVTSSSEASISPTIPQADMTFVIAIAGVGAIILVLALILVCCYKRRKPAVQKNRLNESVYSTIEDNGIVTGGQANLNGRVYPNQVYDANIGYGIKEPFKPPPPPHHKSLPSIVDAQQTMLVPTYQPLTQNPLYSQKNLKSYDDSVIPSTSPYMCLTRERQTTQAPVPPIPTSRKSDSDQDDYMGLIDSRDPVLRNPTPDVQLRKFQRSLPAESNREEYEERANATFGFEQRVPKPRSLPREKPVPAKRTVYKTVDENPDNNSTQENDLRVAENSDDESIPPSPYYFKVDKEDSLKKENPNYTPIEKVKSSRRKPKSRKKPKHGTMEEKESMMSNDVSDDENQEYYTDDDLDTGLEELGLKTLNRDAQPPSGDSFDEGDYNPPEGLRSSAEI